MPSQVLQAQFAQALRSGSLRVCQRQSRLLAAAYVTSLLCRLTGGAHRAAPENALCRGIVLAGPLRRTVLAMPANERPAYLLGSYERHLVRAMSRQLAAGQVVYDVGAHIGYLSLILAKLVGSSGSVYAFEADPRNMACLRSNVAMNRIGNVHPVECAVSDQLGEVEFATFSYSTVSHIVTDATPADATIRRVKAITIDQFVFDRGNPPPQFIKIDVEGAEERVLHGARRTLQTFRPVVVAEVRAGSTAPPIQQLMDSCGYRSQVLKGTKVADVLFTPTTLPPPSPSIGEGPG